MCPRWAPNLQAHREVSVHTEGAVKGSVEANNETEGARIQHGEETGEDDGVVDRTTHGALEVDANATVVHRNCSGLRAGKSIVEEVRLEGLVREGETPGFTTPRDRVPKGQRCVCHVATLGRDGSGVATGDGLG